MGLVISNFIRPGVAIKWISEFIVLLCLCLSTAPLAGGWSTPPEVIYPLVPPNNATNPFIATDANGNSVAVWFDVTGIGSMQAATLASGAFNIQGQPNWVLTSPVSTLNVQAPNTPYAHAVGMDANGTATAVWTDNIFVYVSTLTLGQSVWSAPLIINTLIVDNTISNLYIAVAANGNAVVTWTSSVNPYDGTIFSNVFDAGTQLWLGQVNILPGGVELTQSVNQVSIDPNGNAVVVLTPTSNGMQAVSYLVNSNTWTQIPSIATDQLIFTTSTIDPSGNAIIVWIEVDETIHAATLAFNQTALTNSTLLSSTACPISCPPLVKADAAGNAVAVWPDVSGDIDAARYSFTTHLWTGIPTLVIGGGNDAELISISGDASGNIVMAWLATDFIQVAQLAVTDSTWQMLTQISPADVNNNPQIILDTNGNAIAIWENDTNSGVGTIETAAFVKMFNPAPLSPNSFRGKIIENKFSIQIDRIHQLNWMASTDLSVISYRLYRNSILITTIPSRGTSYSYADHNRNKKISDTYKLVSVNASDIESTPLYVTLQ